MSGGTSIEVHDGDASLVLAGIRRDLGGVEVLRDVDLSVGSGACVALIGSNGAGKTTTLAVAAGDLRPDAGSVRVGGLDPHDPGDVSASRRAVAFVRDAASFYPDLTVAEMVTLVAIAHGVGDGVEPVVEEVVATFGLADHHAALPDHLSAGMRQRLLLACAFVRPFSVLLLDEPARALDPPGRSLLVDHLRRAKEAGAAVVVSTHGLGLVEGLADEVALMESGRITEVGPLDAVRGSAAGRRLGISDPA